jgi:hypothetical protein
MASNSNAVLVVLSFWAYSAGEPRSVVACFHANSVIGCAHHADFATTGAAVIAPDSRADHAFEGHNGAALAIVTPRPDAIGLLVMPHTPMVSFVKPLAWP